MEGCGDTEPWRDMNHQELICLRVLLSSTPTFLFPANQHSLEIILSFSESLSHFLFLSLSHPNVVSKQPRKLYLNYTPDTDLSVFFGSCPFSMLPLSLHLCFIHFPYSSFLLFISFLISFQRQREASKSVFVVIVIQSNKLRCLEACEDENSGARCGDDAYCHDNVTNLDTVLGVFSVPVQFCGAFAPLSSPGNK